MSCKGGTFCSVRGCLVKCGSGLSMFRYPQNTTRALDWLKKCNGEDLIGNQRLKHHKVCELHFEKKFIFDLGSKKKLFDNAVPSIFPFPKVPQSRDHKKNTSLPKYFLN